MLRGTSFIGGEQQSARNSNFFTAVNPATGEEIAPPFACTSAQDIDRAARLAQEAFQSYRRVSGAVRAQFLRAIASNLNTVAEELLTRAHLECGLPMARLEGELVRTTHQLRLFAEMAEESSWVDARIDPALPDRKPLPRPDIRSMLRPLGPIVVFGASNFPLAFSVAGGDTASALAAGNPVMVKAHPAHPGASEIAGSAIVRAVESCRLHPGTFALLFDAGTAVARALVEHPNVRAVAFTGSLRAGRVLMDLAAARPEPIPCFTEMGSTNPLFVLPEALAARAEEIAQGLYTSFTLGVGQFCTKPGLVFVQHGASGDQFVAHLTQLVKTGKPATMLTESIYAGFAKGLATRTAHPAMQVLVAHPLSREQGYHAAPALLETTAEALLADPQLTEELFGPCTLLVRYSDHAQLLALAQALSGQLTATLHGAETELINFADLIEILEQKAGRVLVNGFPTGVEVCDAMVHGGPYPATSDSRFTSVGTQAIFRFVRPVCYQNFPDTALPEELKDENPLGIWRRIDGKLTQNALPK